MFAAVLSLSAPVFAGEAVNIGPFRGVELRGGGNVTLVPGPVQRVTLDGGQQRNSRDFALERDGKLRIDTCNEHCPQIYRMRVEIQSPDLPDLAVTGGGAITAESGFRPQPDLAAAVDGGGKIDTRAVDGINVSAAVNGGGDIFVRARATLAAAINGGGTVRYVGHPEVSSAIRGGGKVRSVN